MPERTDRLTADEALARLAEGNARFMVDGSSEHPRQDTARMAELTGGQAPYACVLGCSDSRVPPELLFDEGLGDLFVIRVAGNVLCDAVMASLEYAGAHLEVPLILVLGHSSCGAVTAVVKQAQLDGSMGYLGHRIQPALWKAGLNWSCGVDEAVVANARWIAEQIIETSPMLAARVDAGTLAVRVGIYDLATGNVEILP